MITTTIIIMMIIKRWFWRRSCFWSADQSGRELLRAMPVDSHKSCFHFNAVVFQLRLEQPATETVKTIQAYLGSEHVHKGQEPFQWGQRKMFLFLRGGSIEIFEPAGGPDRARTLPPSSFLFIFRSLIFSLKLSFNKIRDFILYGFLAGVTVFLERF